MPPAIVRTRGPDGSLFRNKMRNVTKDISISAAEQEMTVDQLQYFHSFSQEGDYDGASVAELHHAIDRLKQQVTDLTHVHREMLYRFHTDLGELRRVLKQSRDENSILRDIHHETSIELERWRIECQDLKHRLGLTDTSSILHTMNNTISREQYNDLERRHRLLHQEFDELRAEKAEVERQLQSTRRVLNNLGNGLDYLRRELPLLCVSNNICEV
ncbi:hypothetical protein LSM04_008363 [Trypanosoma melophagium]|uniref:uncharacterized protein n=1 Tax=Trypanosoma melophagium TaxID=715481 RepID=UPI003519FED8|nr:hypothetical protein LSM04_008363 [Trypanosoma melophagium]